MEKYITEIANELFHEISTSKVNRYGWNKTDYSIWENKTVELLGNLKVDTSYQRSMISKTVIDGMSRNFDINAFDPIVVNIRTMCILDGQHRAIVLIRRGDILYVVVRFVDCPTKEDEARLFHKLNTFSNNVSAIDKYRALYAAKDSLAQTIHDELTKYGYTVTATHKPNGVKCIDMITKSFNQNSECAKDAIRIYKQIAKDEPIAKVPFMGIFYCLTHGISQLEYYSDKIYMNGGIANIIAISRRLSLQYLNSEGHCTSTKIAGLAVLEIVNKGLRRKLKFNNEDTRKCKSL